MTGIGEYSYELGVRTSIDIFKDKRDDLVAAGLSHVPIDNGRLLSDMILKCCSQLKNQPDVVYIAHSIPIIRRGGDDSLSQAFNVPVFYLSGMPCAIMHETVKAAVNLVSQGKCRRIWVVGADKAYSDRERCFFGTVMGDSTVALAIEAASDQHLVLGSYVNTHVYAAYGENSKEEAISSYRTQTTLLLREAYKRCLYSAGVESVDYIAPHTPNHRVWDAFAEATGFDRSAIFDQGLADTGHMNSHDSYFHYLRACEQGLIKKGERVMLINPGFGGTQGCTLIQR